MEELIISPGTPYVGAVYGGKLTPGQMVKIQAVAPVTANRFNISLQCGPETVPRNDIGIQISVRILDGYISLNSLQNGIWGEEQRCLTLPIKLAVKFEIILKCHFDQYKVAINDQHFCDFPKRIHYNQITHLAIDGDVSIFQVSYTSPSGGEEEASSNNIYWIPEPLAAVAPLQIQNETYDVEFINFNRNVTPPPSYEASVMGNDIRYATGNVAAVNLPCSFTTAPYPTESSSMPMPSDTPYNINHTLRSSRPTGVAETRYASYTSSTPGASAPLNATSSNFYPEL